MPRPFLSYSEVVVAQGFMGIFGVRRKPSKTQLLPKILKKHGYETVTRDL